MNDVIMFEILKSYFVYFIKIIYLDYIWLEMICVISLMY